MDDGERRLYAVPGEGDPDCDHEVVTDIGNDAGANRFYECPDCGSILIREGYLPEGDGSTADLGTVDPRIGDLLDDIDRYHETGSAFGPEKETPIRDRLAEVYSRMFR